MDEVLYFHVALEPHHKHSGSLAGGRILFLAEIPVNAPDKSVANPGDQDDLREQAERLVSELLPVAMTGHTRQDGEDNMRFSCHTIPQPSQDLLERKADAEKAGVRLWLLGSNVA